MPSDRDFFDDSQQVLDRSIPHIVASLAKTDRYLLLPQASILSDQAYTKVTPETNSAFNHTNVARGYKRISKQAQLAALARDMGLDGAIHVDVDFAYSNEGTNIVGLVDFGKNYATVKINVTAVNSDGKVNRFIDLKDVQDVLELHPLTPGHPYYLGVFLVGAYQDTIGDYHNLLGLPAEAYIIVGERGDWHIKKRVGGSTIGDVLREVKFERGEVQKEVDYIVNKAVENDLIKKTQRSKIAKEILDLLDDTTYISPR